MASPHNSCDTGKYRFVHLVSANWPPWWKCRSPSLGFLNVNQPSPSRELTFANPTLEILVEFLCRLAIAHEVMGVGEGASHRDEIGDEPSSEIASAGLRSIGLDSLPCGLH